MNKITPRIKAIRRAFLPILALATSLRAVLSCLFFGSSVSFFYNKKWN